MNRIVKNKGFALLELVIVVGIVSTLAGIAIPNALKGRISANEAKALKTLKDFASALEQYSLINGSYPSSLDLIPNASPPYYPENVCDGTERSGYDFTVNAGYPSGGTYTIIAAPTTCQSSGNRIFTVNTGLVMTEVDCTP